MIFRSGSSPVLHISNFPVPVRSVSNISGSVPVRFYFSNYAPVPVPVRFYIFRFRFRSGSTFKNILRFRSGPFLTFPVPFRSGAKFQNRRRALISIYTLLYIITRSFYVSLFSFYNSIRKYSNVLCIHSVQKYTHLCIYRHGVSP